MLKQKSVSKRLFVYDYDYVYGNESIQTTFSGRAGGACMRTRMKIKEVLTPRTQLAPTGRKEFIPGQSPGKFKKKEPSPVRAKEQRDVAPSALSPES